MILENKRLEVFIFIIGLGIFTYFFVTFFVNRFLGHPIGSYWGIIFFLTAAGFSYLFKDVLEENNGVLNIANIRYYIRLPIVTALFVLLPIICYLFYMLISNIYITPQEAKSVFVGFVREVDKKEDTHLQYDVAKFTVEHIFKGDEASTYEAQSGLIIPDGCGIQLKPGDIFVVYIVKNLGFTSISCQGSKQVDKIGITDEEALGIK